jgi:hypothetical protein
MLLTNKRDKGMTNVEKFFKEWGSVCRMLTKKDKAIYSHKELLDFAEQYHQSKVNNVVLDDVTPRLIFDEGIKYANELAKKEGKDVDLDVIGMIAKDYTRHVAHYIRNNVG